MIEALRHAAAVLAVAAVAVLVGACATPPPPAKRTGTVILLPEKDGRDTSVTVRQGEQQVVLDRPYAAAELTTAGPRAYTSTPQEVEARFGAALAARPARPTSFTLHFVEGRDELTDESKRTFEDVLARLARYPVPDIVVVGHTDAVGGDAFNDALARQRAETVRAALVRRGVAAENVVAVGRGKREPVVPTPDGVAEPRNRRVEIIVR